MHSWSGVNISWLFVEVVLHTVFFKGKWIKRFYTDYLQLSRVLLCDGSRVALINKATEIHLELRKKARGGA